MKKLLGFICSVLLIACQQTQNDKQAIIQTLKNETKYFCERDIDQWAAQWLQQDLAYKMYAGNHKFEEFIGWQEIRQFTLQHIQEKPEEIPLPETNFDYDIRLFGKTAWVFYSKNVDGEKVRETRFLLKENEKWKIARMQTVF